MSTRRFDVRLTEVEIRSLLALVPQCKCGSRAEIILNRAPICVPCAARIRHGDAHTPAWSSAADALDLALSPFEVSA